ncbi:MAG: hypothetical protein ABIH23_28160, partial [bacterium]
MRKTVFLVSSFSALVVLLLVLWPNGSKKEESQEIVRKTASESPTPGLTRASPTPESAPSPLERDEKTEIPRDDNEGLAVRLTDALGDPIPNGVIEIASRTYESAQSGFAIPDATSGTHVLLARADGFQSATRTVELPKDASITMTLEYVCEFVVEAQDKSGNPVEGALVSLLEGAVVPRPVRNSVTVVTRKDAIGEGSLTLRRKGRGICIDSIRGTQSVRMDTGDGGEEKRYLARGDVVVGLGLKSHEFTDTATPLKLWDSISVFCSNSDSPNCNGSLKTRQGTRILTTEIYGQKQPREMLIVSTLYTDQAGKCRFENVWPGLYYVVAAKDDTQSEPRSLCPLDNSASLTLRNKNNNSVVVFVDKAGFQYRRKRGIAESDVHLSGLDSVILLSGKTGASGFIILEPVPQGRYELTAAPPADLKAEPLSKKIEVLVDKPRTEVRVEFHVDVGVTISGIVLREDTKEPVPDYPLKLMINRGSKSLLKAVWRDYAVTRSDSEGRFEFKYVLPGGYMITSYSANEHATDYLHSGKALRFCNPENPLGKPEPHFEVTDKDITGVVYTILPGVRTVLSGSVVTENGDPVADAGVTVDRLYDEFIESGGRSDTDGQFALSLMIPESDKAIESEIRATLKAVPIERKYPDYKGRFFTMYEDGGLAAEASVPITFSGGDVLRDIRIVVKEKDKGQVLYGRILTHNGGVLECP